VVLNKADRATEEEKAAAMGFTRQLLEKRLHRSVGPVFEISAAERIQRRGAQRDWAKLIEELQRLAQDSGRHLVRAACKRGIERLSEQLLIIVSEEREALERPIQESERRIAAMKRTIAEAESSMRDLSFVFMAEQRHLSDIFAGPRRAFLASALPRSNREFQMALETVSRRTGPLYRRGLMATVQEIARRHVLPWLRSEQEAAEKEYRRVMGRFAQIGSHFLRRLADAGISDLACMPHALDPEAGLRIRSRFSFLDLIEVAQPASPLRWLADLILGFVGARKVIEGEAREFLTRLLESNSTRVQSDILNRVQESRARLELEIRKLLCEISCIAQEALTRARTAHAAGPSAVQTVLAPPDDLERRIRDFRPTE